VDAALILDKLRQARADEASLAEWRRFFELSDQVRFAATADLPSRRIEDLDRRGDRPAPQGGKEPAVISRIQNSGVRSPHGILRFLTVFLLAVATRAAPADEARYERTFADAVRAYDENRLPEAIAGGEALLRDGQVLPEVLFNLGNAYYRNGNLGPAIRAYRQAQTLAPRDPDIRANLGFAAQTAGIGLPARHPLVALLLDASRAEWRFAASTAYALLFLALAAWILWPLHRRFSRPAALLAGLLLAVALAGLWAHRDLRLTPEAVVMTPEQKLLSGPLDSATPLLAVPAGSLVRQLDTRGPWVEVQTDGTRGWLPATALAPIAP
jgi:tetratricopeptide (TPR) repeat protein